MVGYALWKVNFGTSTKVLLLSQAQPEADEMVAKAKFVYDHLPEYMQQPRDINRTSWLSFGENYSELKALPSTDRAGTGYNATLIVRDELYRHPEGEKNFMAVAPATDSGGQLIDLSAVYGDDMDSHFVQRVKQIYGVSGTVKTVYPSGLIVYTNPAMPSRVVVFLGWKLRPVRLEGLTLDEFYETRLKPRYTERELDRQYPATIEDALRIALTSAYFEYQALEDMGYDCSAPIKQTEIDTYNGIIRVYKLPDKSRRYVLFTDPSAGVEDPFVTGVLDFVTGEVVCTAVGMEKIDRVSAIHDYLVKQYNAVNSYEYNAVGMAMEQCLTNLGTPLQAPRRKTDGTPDEEKKGQFVSEKHKRMMFADLAAGIARRQVVIHDREFIQQAKLVTRDEEGFPVTERKLSFDWVMMMNGLWQLQKHAPKSGASIRTYSPNREGGYILGG